MAAFTGTPAPASTSIGIGKPTDQKTPLIQEISQTTNDTEPKSKSSSNSLPGLRGIMKNSSSKPSPLQNIDPNVPLDWSWTKEDSGRLRIQVNVPGLVGFFLLFLSS